MPLAKGNVAAIATARCSVPFEPIQDSYIVRIPDMGVDGLSSARAQFNKTLVPADNSPLLPFGQMQEGVYPIAAISTTPPIKRIVCGPGSVYKDDGMSRVAITVSGITLVDKSIVPSQDWRLTLQVRASNGFVSMGMRQYKFDFVPDFFPGPPVSYRSGMVALYGGPLCTQYEIWGVVTSSGPAEPVDIEMSLTLHVDRLGNGEQSIPSPATLDEGTSLIFPYYY